MKNKISDLRNHMFEALERLNNEDLSPDDLEREIKRATAISEVGKVIVDSAKTEVMFMKITGKPKKGFIDNADAENFVDEPKTLERPKAEYSNTNHLLVAAQ